MANDKVLDRQVAVKIVHPAYLRQNPKASEILYDEAKTGASLLGHPNIVAVLDFGEFDDGTGTTNFIVMEYVDGMTVASWISDVKTKLDKETYYRISLLISLEICKAIEYAHKKGILHRDIKPLNAFLSKYGVSKIGDFGVARFVDAVTRTHTVHGTMSPAYSSPEQWRGEKHTEEMDVYQLGCTIYQLFTGQLPFEVDSMFKMMNAHLTDTPEPPMEIMEKMSEKLSKSIMKTLEKESKNRNELWRLHDDIITELNGTYVLTIDISGEDDDVIEEVSYITQFPFEDLKKGKFKFAFPDFIEVLSECIEIVSLGITSFNISKKVESPQTQAETQTVS